MSQGNEFEFLDDESGGRFVRAGGPVGQLRELLARQDIDAAVRVYEESNGAAREPVLEEAKMASFETRKIIGQMLKRARDFVTAAEVFELSKLESDAAQCFEAGGDYVRAGVSWRRLGDLTKAASCFQRAGRLEDALELYRQAGSQEGLAECLAKAGRFVDDFFPIAVFGEKLRRGSAVHRERCGENLRPVGRSAVRMKVTRGGRALRFQHGVLRFCW